MISENNLNNEIHKSAIKIGKLKDNLKKLKKDHKQLEYMFVKLKQLNLFDEEPENETTKDGKEKQHETVQKNSK